MRVRTLMLRKETLAELTARELRDVVGATSDVPTAELVSCMYQTLTACPDYYCTGTI